MEGIGNATETGEMVVYLAIPSFLKVIVKIAMGSASWTHCVGKALLCTAGRSGSGMMAGGRLTFPLLLGWLGR